jgi:hypothetical protein
MFSDDLLGKIFNVATAAWTAVLMLAVRLFHTWPNIQARQNERKRDAAAEKAGDWDRLRDENKRLHTMLAKCEAERIEWMGRAVTSESVLQGLGYARQQAAQIIAVERLEEAAKRDAGEK